MKVIILCGGSGTRLWPLSRKSYPKQFLKINDKYSFLQKTVERFLNFLSPEDIFLITNKEQKFLILEQLKDIGFEENGNLIFEPVGKNTAPAIAYALSYINEYSGIDEEETIFVSPSDHLISPIEDFIDFIKKGESVALSGKIVTFGIEPNSPETGYGYIKKADKLDFNFDVFDVDKFVEKPDLKTAENYLLSKEYFWNSGMFLFTYQTILNEFKNRAAEIYEYLNNSFKYFTDNFDKLPKISIDYAVMEKSDKISVLPVKINWSDIGSWDSVYDLMPKDECGNIITDKVFCENTNNSMFIVNGRLIAAIGLEDIMIVETDDAVLIAKKGETQKVKDIVDKISQNKKFKELAEIHTVVNRPWGSFKTLEKGSRYKIKKIIVNRGESLSLQKHYHRSEHWVVVRGTAKVTVNEKEFFVHENESIYVPKSAKHRLENPGKLPLEIIEVQVGEYVEEDDIERFEDLYGRSSDSSLE